MLIDYSRITLFIWGHSKVLELDYDQFKLILIGFRFWFLNLEALTGLSFGLLTYAAKV